MADNIRRVNFKIRQNSSEDLYYCPENHHVYVRQPANVPGIVFWYTSTKWSGGYEASCPLREGLVMVVDGKYEETIVAGDEWNSSTRAEKKFPFSWEEERDE